LAESQLVLIPRSGDSKESTRGCVSAPILEKLEDLTLALDEVERSEASTSKMTRSKDDGSMGIATVPALGDE
jgi:hypothetical protein